MNLEQLCMGCMGERGDVEVCPLCGWTEGTPPDLPVQLTPRTSISEKYLLGRVLGQGGFGITYLAWDVFLNRKLAIKEYFPREICGRGRDSITLQPLSQKSVQGYQYGLAKFVEEGRNLARFRDYPGIVSLLDFFEANGTAYIVMAYMEGMTFKQYLEEQGGKITFDQAVTILNPVMDALREVHRIGMLHRDISPDNIYLNRDRQVKILDFGATRYAMREQSQNLTVLIKPGYAPLEQYSSGGKQGPWSDVYATGATFYRALTGKAPSEAPDRLAQDDLVPPSRMSIAIPAASEVALLKALTVHYQSRFQTMEDFQKAVVPRTDEGTPPEPVPIKSSPVMLWALLAMLLLATLASSAMWLRARGQLISANATIADLHQRLSQMPQDNHPGTQDDSALREQVNALTADRAALQRERDDLKSQLAAALSKPHITPPPVKVPPSLPVPSTLSVAYFQLFSSDGDGNNKVGPTDHFSKGSLKYVLCQLGGPNPLRSIRELTAPIEVRFFEPSGSLRRVVPQTVSATQDKVLWTAQALWGNSQPGVFQGGSWRVEVWSGKNKIGEKTFQVN